MVHYLSGKDVVLSRGYNSDTGFLITLYHDSNVVDTWDKVQGVDIREDYSTIKFFSKENKFVLLKPGRNDTIIIKEK